MLAALPVQALDLANTLQKARGARCTTELETEDLNSKSPTTLTNVTSFRETDKI